MNVIPKLKKLKPPRRWGGRKTIARLLATRSCLLFPTFKQAVVLLMVTLNIASAAIRNETPAYRYRKLQSLHSFQFLNAQRIKPNEIHPQLTEVYGEPCLDVKNVYKWCREFSAGAGLYHKEICVEFFH